MLFYAVNSEKQVRKLINGVRNITWKLFFHTDCTVLVFEMMGTTNKQNTLKIWNTLKTQKTD